MKTLASLEIGQRFNFYRKATVYIYFGYLDGEHHFVMPHAEGCNVNQVETISQDAKVITREYKPNEIVLAKWKARGYKLN